MLFDQNHTVSRKNKLFALGSILLFFAAKFHLGPGADPDQPFGMLESISTVLIFAFWAVGISGWGVFLSKVIRLRNLYWAEVLGLGTAFGSIFVCISGHLGLIGLDFSWLFWLVTIAGVVMFFSFPLPGLRAPSFSGRGERIIGWIILVLISSVFILRFLKAQNPWGQSDPLFYQLLGPRLWSEAGRIYFPDGSPLVYMSSYWEYLHVWAVRLLSGQREYGWIEVQLFAQMTHVVFGGLGVALTVHRISKKFLSLPDFIALLCVLVAISLRDFDWIAFLAKNDWGVAFWSLLGVSIVLEATSKDQNESGLNKIFALAGGFLGLAVGAKFTNAVFVSVFGLAYLIWSGAFRISRYRTAFVVMSSVALGFFLPYLLRNLFSTGNPLFPFFNNLFPATMKVSPGLAHMVSLYETQANSHGVGYYVGYIQHLLTVEPLIIPAAIAGLLGMMVVLIKRKISRLFYLIGVSALSVLIFMLFGTQTEIRHFGASLILMAGLGPAGVYAVLNTCFPKREAVNVWVSAVYILFTLSFSSNLFLKGNYGTVPLVESIFQKNPAKQIREQHEAGRALAWLRMNGTEKARVVVINGLQFYYLPKFYVSSFEESSEFIELIEVGLPPIEYLSRLNGTHKYRYLLDVKHAGVVSPLSLYLNGFYSSHPCVVLFESHDARVIDLDLVVKFQNTECPKPSG